MKIRNGFVSNSSSTSFSIVMSEKDWYAAFKAAPETTQVAIIKCGGPNCGEVAGGQIVLVNGEYGDVNALFGKPFKADKFSALNEFLEILESYPQLEVEEHR